VDLHALRSNGLLAPDVEQPRLAEEYRVIKRPIVDNADAHRDPPIPLGNLLMVASAVAGEGKTFSCVNLCLSIAREKDWNVVLVDGDVSKPHLTRLFSAESEPGILDLLRDQTLTFDSLVMPTNIPGLSFLPAGNRDQNAAELLSSRRMRDVCEQISAADAARLIIFDTSPLLLTSEAAILASQVGQVVVIVHADTTSRHAVASAIEKLDRSKPIGCVLNQQSARLGAVYGYYGYGEYGT
jgi:exopolysaccharide/PEP-CTERM locus tyrosine autokinase